MIKRIVSDGGEFFHQQQIIKALEEFKNNNYDVLEIKRIERATFWLPSRNDITDIFYQEN